MSAKVAALPVYKLHDVPEALRQAANRIEHGELSAVRCVLAMELPDGGVEYTAFGEEPFTRAHAAGLCFAVAKELV